MNCLTDRCMDVKELNDKKAVTLIGNPSFKTGTIFLICCVFLCFYVPTGAQTDSSYWKLSALKTAKKLETTFRQHDFRAYALLNHPKLVEMIGTVDDLAAIIEDQMKQIEAEVKIDSIEFGVPFNFMKCERSINCLLPQTLYMQINDSVALRSTVYLLGVSENESDKWYFVDATNGVLFLNAIVPNRCKIYAIPSKEQEYIRAKKTN